MGRWKDPRRRRLRACETVDHLFHMVLLAVVMAFERNGAQFVSYTTQLKRREEVGIIPIVTIVKANFDVQGFLDSLNSFFLASSRTPTTSLSSFENGTSRPTVRTGSPL
jgi:hypothetical protein